MSAGEIIYTGAATLSMLSGSNRSERMERDAIRQRQADISAKVSEGVRRKIASMYGLSAVRTNRIKDRPDVRNSIWEDEFSKLGVVYPTYEQESPSSRSVSSNPQTNRGRGDVPTNPNLRVDQTNTRG